MSSVRKVQVLSPTWATSRSSRTFIPKLRLARIRDRALKIGWRRPILMAFRQRRRRIGNHLLKQQVHEQEQRLGLEDQQDRFIVRVVVEVLMHTAILDEHDI